MQEYQTHFVDIDPNWPRRASTEIKKAGQKVYKNAFALWQRVGVELPKSQEQWQNSSLSKIPFAGEFYIQPRHGTVAHPRICDIEVPPEFQSFLELYSRKTTKGFRSPIPINLLDLYDHWPIKPEEDILEYLPISDQYDKWFRSW